MSSPRVAAGAAALVLSGLGVLGLQSPAYANHNCPNPAGKYPPGQGGQACQTEGHGDNAGGNGEKVKPGDKIDCDGKDYKPDSEGFCYAKSSPILLGTLIANAAGVIHGSFDVPAGLEAGNHSLVLTGIGRNGQPKVTVKSFTVTPATATTGGKGTTPSSSGKGTSTTSVGGVQLPRTGAEIASVSVVGLGLLGAGGVALLSGRRRRVGAAS